MEKHERTALIPPALGSYAIVAGIISFVGWLADIPRLTDWDNNGISMQPNATLAATGAGAALVLLAMRRLRPAAVLGLLPALFGATALFEYVSDIDLGIDTLLMFDRPWGRVGTLVPGRMGPPGALSWSVLGAGLILAGRGAKARQAAALLGLTAMCIAALSLIGYLFGADSLYSLPRLTTIALQTSTMIFAVGIGLTAAIPECQPTRLLLQDTGAGLLARRTLPFIVLVPITVGLLRLWGERAGLYDTEMGTALMVLTLILWMTVVLWSCLAAVANREAALTVANQTNVRAEMLLRSASDQFIMLDRDWRHIYVNDRVIAVTGIAREKLLGQSFWQLWPAVIGTPLEKALRQTMEQRAMESLDYYFQPWNGWFENRIYPTADGGLAIFALDITERKNAEQQIDSLLAELRQADRRKDEFIATLSHELRNPLAPIRNAVEILKTLPAEPKLDWCRDLIDSQVGQMSRLMEDLLDVSRISQGKIELRKTRVTLKSIVDQALETSRPHVEAAGHKLSVSLPPGSVYLDADPVRIAQVFSNLINNASKYSENNSSIEIKASLETGKVVLSVKDAGIGIAPEHLVRIFELFSQVGSALERAQGGLGIGLALVRGLVEQHGGSIEARSEGLGKGSEFVVCLPLAVGEPELPGNEAIAAKLPRIGSGKRVVIVDDNQLQARSAAMVLELAGYDTRTAHDGPSALRTVAEFVPQVVLIDIGLPGMDGYEVARRLRELPQFKGITLIAQTGWGREEDRTRSRQAGFDHHLTKPLDYERLEQLLN